jgi:hypothetical protein
MSGTTNQPGPVPGNPYAADLGERDLKTALVETPERLRTIVEAMAPADFGRSYAPGKWTATQLLVHLAQCELVFNVRVRMALSADAYVVQPFDQDAWMSRDPLADGLAAFRGYYALRQISLPLYRSLTPSELSKGLTHPERGPMALQGILEVMAGHELHHVPHFEVIAGMRP